MEGAREVTMHWAAHVPLPKAGSNVQDFRKLNRMAAKANVPNAVELAKFKKCHNVQKIDPPPMGAQPKVIPSDVIPSFAYGRKSRPSTPISAVVGYQYSAEYEEALTNQYWRYETEAPPAKSKVRLTKSSKALIMHSAHKRASVEKREEPELFKLSKFKKVSSRLQLAPLSYSQSVPVLN